MHALLTAFDIQVKTCTFLEAPFTAHLLACAATDIVQGGRAAALMKPFCDWDEKKLVKNAVALRFAGAIHALALAKEDMTLTAHYQNQQIENLWAAVAPVLEKKHDWIINFMKTPPQTNEVGRAAILLGGFLEIAYRFEKPLALYEIGASAGLNLFWDQFFYQPQNADWQWGNPQSAVRLSPQWEGEAPRLDATIEIASRAGCDKNPVMLKDYTRLAAYVWPDQPERGTRLAAAIKLAKPAGAQLDAARAFDWLHQKLATANADQVAVVYHSIVWQYIETEEREKIEALLAKSAAKIPLAWLRLELDETATTYALLLSLWDGGVSKTQQLAIGHPHGSWIGWNQQK